MNSWGIPPDIREHVEKALGGEHPISPVNTGMSGAMVATAGDPVVFFIKWGGTNSSHKVRIEAANLLLVGSVNLGPTIVHYDPEVPLLITRAIQRNLNLSWDEASWEAACLKLERLREVPPGRSAHVSSLPFFRDRGTAPYDAAVCHLNGDKVLARRLADSYDGLRFWEQDENRDKHLLCHADAHSANWILTSHGPMLIDFEHLQIGPRGFDEGSLLVSLEVPTKARMRWLHSANLDLDIVRTTVGAWTARFALGLGSDMKEWRDWCKSRWETSLALAKALG